MSAYQILVGDCIDQMRGLPDQSVNTCVTSPPYFGLRDYGMPGQIGLEDTPDAFVARLVEVFREVRRVLRDDGTLFLNLGDSYCSANSEALFCLREDCTLEVARDVGLEVFGLRIDGAEAPGQGAVPEVLSGGSEGQALCGRPDLASQGEQALLRAEPRSSHPADDRPQQANEGQSDGRARGKVRLLRGDTPAISDDRPHSRRRGSASKGADGKEPGIIGSCIPGHSEAGLPAGSVQGSLLELQLRARIVRLLSSRQLAAADIPHRLREHFRPVGIKPKDLIGIPWRVAFALQADGWYLRQDIIWHKPNPMPESVTDRCTKAHEYLFLISKGPRYYYDAEAITETATNRPPGTKASDKHIAAALTDPKARTKANLHKIGARETRNRRSVWTVTTKPYSGAHFATFPPDLIEPCILAGCPSGGTVLDPFGGSGTTAGVAIKQGRKAILCELNPDYVGMIEDRVLAIAGHTPDMFREAAE